MDAGTHENNQASFQLHTDFPISFTFQCKSGEFVFGQMQCIVEGMKTNLHDGV